MTERLAILAGSGILPRLIQDFKSNCLAISFQGVEHSMAEPVAIHRVERLGAMFDALRAGGVTHVVMAGAMQRPRFDASQLDPFTAALLPDLAAAMGQGDDHVLRFLITLIEAQGFSVIGAHDVVNDLTLAQGDFVGTFPHELTQSLRRADHVLSALAPCDLGQAVVAEAGQVIGVETLQGTEFMLRCVSQTDPTLRVAGAGILVKRPKAGQDLRVDMPAIGPDTIDQVADAGLVGIVVSPETVMILDRATVEQRAKERNVFIAARAMTC